jgi:hypothetical protein
VLPTEPPPRIAETDAILTIRPDRWRVAAGMAAFTQLTMPATLTRAMPSHSEAGRELPTFPQVRLVHWRETGRLSRGYPLAASLVLCKVDSAGIHSSSRAYWARPDNVPRVQADFLV